MSFPANPVRDCDSWLSPAAVKDFAIATFEAFGFKAWHALVLGLALILAWGWRKHVTTR